MREERSWVGQLDALVAQLRARLLQHRALWPRLAQQAHLASSTIEGFANDANPSRNPRLSTLRLLATTLDRLLAEPVPPDDPPERP